jgi:hypothetical protein
MRTLFALLLIVCVGTSCSHNKRASDEIELGGESTLHVENHHYGDVDIFVVHNGSRTRVGSVTATSEQTFTLNPRIIGTVGTLQILAHGVGEAGSISSEQFAIRPGMQISWTLDSSLSRATLAIY